MRLKPIGYFLLAGMAWMAGSISCGGGGSSSSSASTPVAPSGLTYSVNPAVYTVGTPITANCPSCSGGAVASYSVSPALPLGLSLNPATGVISGTPVAVTASAAYTFTATNSAGDATDAINITVNAAVVAPSNLTYAVNPATYTVGTAITANTPSSSGGDVTAYSVSPALPLGLSLNTSTGAISGIPTTVDAAATYTVTASNSAGQATAGLNITVNAAVVAPSNLTYAVNPATYTVGTAITANTPSSSGGDVTAYSVSPALPAGLSLNTNTGVISGTPTTATSTATYTITASNSAGSTTAGLKITVNPVLPVANAGSAQNVGIGSTVTLDGSGSSDSGSSPLTYTWTLTTVPSGSAAVLNSSSVVKPTFIADVAGTYKATLVVSDGQATSFPATVTIVSYSNFNQLFQIQSSQAVVSINNTVQAGSEFFMGITNNSSNGTFQLTKFELIDGATVVSSITSSSLLNNGSLAPGQNVGLTTTLSSSEVNNGFVGIYYLTNPITSTSFTVSYSFVVD